MYYLVRGILILIILLCAFLALVKSKKLVFFTKKKNPEIYQQFKTDKRFKQSVYVTDVAFIVFLLAIIAATSFPFEGSFVTFDSVNDSLAYKLINTENLSTYDYSDCVFVVDNSNDKIYSVTKTNGRYKLVDYNSENIEYVQVSQRGRDETTEPLKAKYNKDTNKTFYYVGVGGKVKPHDGAVTFDGKKMEYCRSEEQISLVGSATWYTWIYSFMDDSEPRSQASIFSGTKELQISKLKQVFLCQIPEK